MNLSPMMKLGVVLGALFAAYKYGPAGAAKTAAVAVGAVILAKQLPVVQDVLA